MKAIIDAIASLIEIIVDSISFITHFFNFVPATINAIMVYIVELPLFLWLPIVAAIWCAFLRAMLSRGGASS